MERLSKPYCNGQYVIFSDGQIYSNKSHKYLRQFDNGNGYMTVCICCNGKPKTKYVHRLVAETFLPNPHNFSEVNHKDENPSNNELSNLEWCSAKYNKNYGNRAKKFSISRGKPVKCLETGVIYHGVREASRQVGISASSISACCKGYRNAETAGGFHWTEVNLDVRETKSRWNG